MKHLLPLTFAAFAALSAPVFAGSPVVVELFTSQGCSSCPPADEMMYELAKRDDVIVLALHVDYWDYIGWKDEFADPDFTKRQRGYAIEGGRRSVYTPQMIVNGTTAIVGARPMQLSKAIADHSAQPSTVDLDVSRDGDRVRILATSEERGESLIVHMVRYQSERTSTITRGENAGQTLTYTNVAEDWKILQEWDGATELDLTAQVEGENPVVVMIQKGRNGPILAAAQLR